MSEALGAEPVFLNYADGEVPDSNEARETLCELIRTKKPDIVLTHWRGSFHKDHIATHKVMSDPSVHSSALFSQTRKTPKR